MYSKKNSYSLKQLTLERMPNPGHCNPRNDRNSSITSARDAQEQANSITFKPFLGLLYLFIHAFFNQLSSVIIKMLPYIGPCQLSLIRQIGTFVGNLPFVAYYTHQVFGEKKYRILLLLRGFFGATGILLQIMAYSYLSLAEASIILSTLPIMTSVVARVMLKESFGVAKSISLVMTVCGVLLVLRIPELLRNRKDVHFDSVYIAGVMAALGTVLCLAFGTVYVRKVKEVHYSTVVMYFSATGVVESSLLNGIFISYVPTICGWDQLLCILFGVLCFISNYLFTMGVHVEPASLASVQKSSFDILIIIVFQAIFFNSYPDIYVICGACIVLVSLIILGIKNWLLVMPENSNIRRKLKFLL